MLGRSHRLVWIIAVAALLLMSGCVAADTAARQRTCPPTRWPNRPRKATRRK